MAYLSLDCVHPLAVRTTPGAPIRTLLVGRGPGFEAVVAPLGAL
jgi:hypothetical protein